MQRTNGIQLVLGMSAISALASGQVTVSGCVPAVGSPVTFGFKEQGLEAFSEQISGAVTKPRPRSHRDKPQEHRGWWQCLSWAGGTAALGVSTQLLGHRPVSPLPSSISRWAAPNHVHSAADSSQWGCQVPFPSPFSHPKLTTSLLPGLRSSPQTALPSLKSRLKDVMGGRGGGLCLHTLLLLLFLLLGLSSDAESPENAHRGAKHTSSRVLWWRAQDTSTWCSFKSLGSKVSPSAMCHQAFGTNRCLSP